MTPPLIKSIAIRQTLWPIVLKICEGPQNLRQRAQWPLTDLLILIFNIEYISKGYLGPDKKGPLIFHVWGPNGP